MLGLNTPVKVLKKEVLKKVIITDFPKVDLHLPKRKK